MVATPEVTALRAPARARPARADARVVPRWVAPAVVGTVDALALALAVRLVAPITTLTFLYILLALVTLSGSGAYRTRMTLSALDAAPWLCTRLAAPLLLLAPAAFVGGDVGALLRAALVALPVVFLARCASYAALRHLRRAGHLLEPAVILGAGEIGVELAGAFGKFPELGVVPVGFLDQVLDDDLPYPLLGDVDELPALLAQQDVRRVIVAFGPARESELVSVLRTAVQYDVDVHVVPRFFDCGVAPEGPDTDDVQGIPLYRVRRAALRAPAWFAKRLLDVAVSGLVLLVTAPLFGLIAVAVKLSSPGPVLFRQARVGQDGQEIDVPKFRTLRVNHDSDTHWSVDQDPRVTGIGRILRATSLDELPQLWSVFTGQMSLVGPRPERAFFVARFRRSIRGYNDRHRLPVGLTGWAQVHGLRGDTSIEERARYDNQYIEHWSLWRDVVILLRTVAEVFRSIRAGTR
jgi:exopolysaccharide biosynthesis polyprenyl glycosylphosphotransferase